MRSNQEFGPILKDLRTKAGFTLRDLATKVGVDVSYLSKIENGRVPPPSEAVVFKLAEALKTDKNKLLDLAGIIPAALAETMKNRARLEFGKRLRELRIRAGLTQNELASIVGVAPSYLSKVETGSKDPPSRKVLPRLADALGIDLKLRK
jgi:transcriptional regulator with XRE-family HTH domain